MVEKKYDWEDGALLEEHTKKKHEILKNYFRQYLLIRCQLPQQEKFRLAIVDGFSGAGLYKCGSFGSPLIFVDVLIKATNEINLLRIAQGIKPIQIDCLLLLNDFDKSVTEQLKKNLTPLLAQAKDTCQNLFIETEYFSQEFEKLYPEIKARLISAKCSNVFFNLDQCGYSDVTSIIIKDIINSWRSAEVLLTFAIRSLLTFLSPNSNAKGVPLEPELKLRIDALLKEGEIMLGKQQWLAEAEKIAFGYLKDCAGFVSPFSINNPSGWQYWLMHFANSYRARQVYNDVLHQSDAQAHFGKAGLKMLSYDPREEGQLYLFDNDSRQEAKKSLYEDIPRFVAESGDTMSMQDFYAAAYSETPAHSQDIHEMIIENTDMEVLTETGGKRRLPNTIKPSDTLKLKSQKSLFFMFPGG
ncbi:MAG: three-Cys-motif partner protein TcmP [Porticoccaceae bacterium]|nr:three-Cys-motif partner protein TcmP [Porticoccaceae bacterium]